LAGGELLDVEDQHAVDDEGFVQRVEMRPSDFILAGPVFVHLCKHGSGKGRWARPRDDCVKVKGDVGDRHLLLGRDLREPRLDVFDELEHDREARPAHEGPLTKAHALLAEDRVVAELGLVDLHADDHVDVGGAVAGGDKAVGRLECFDVDVCVDASLGVHDHVPEEVGFHNGGVDGTVQLDDIRAVKPLGTELFLHVKESVVVCQDFVAVAGVHGCPCPGCVKVPLFKV
jgi:hypothetical protein